MNEVFRQEKKYLISIDEYVKHSHYLSQLLQQDSHNGLNGYMIRSLYFDTLDDRDYFEKLNGLYIRRKIRLRIYDPASEYAHLEMKQKQGPYQKKRSLQIKRADAIQLCKGNYSSLLNYPEPFAAECYGYMNMHCYRPTAVIQYNRKAFIAKENKIRITFDNHIEATESCFDIFSNNLNMHPVLDRFNVVLEVKYNHFLLSYIRSMINQCSKSELAVCKYVLGRRNLINHLS